MALRVLQNLVTLLISCSIMVGVSYAARPLEKAMASSNYDLISVVCYGSGLTCVNDYSILQTAESDVAKAASLRDASIHTINDVQRDFFMESALVGGGKMSLDENLRDPAGKRAFLTSSAADKLPSLASSNALDLMQRFGVAQDSNAATAVATAAYLCGSAALPGEAMSCAASIDAMAAFVAAELGQNVKVFSTNGAPASTPAVRAPVTVVDVAKGSVAEGERIVVCHHIGFPSSLYYCHRVTGTRVVKATLKPEGYGSSLIKAVGVCHLDTSLWLSTHPAFAALNIPRGDEACHWLEENDLVFVPAMSQISE